MRRRTAHAAETGIHGLGAAVKEAGAAAAAHWAEEFRVAGEGLRQLAQKVDDDLAAFAALDQGLVAPGERRGGGRRAEAV
ncbi:hypothetical protein [Agromyces italicus]|uniref:hypothetical protein n=1 Tax=Agromyces italicus TaxID=279572 RepID=UPI0004233702|nr:hypothetical protein [Agromyces italicus]